MEGTEDGKKLTSSISKDSRLKEINDSINKEGILSFDPKIIAAWFVWYANEKGRENAQKELNNWLNNKKDEFVDALWVVGIQTEQIIKISEYILIVPVSKMPLSEEQQQFSSFSSTGIFTPFQPQAAIVFNSKPQSFISDESLKEGEDLESLDNIYDVAHMLNAIGDITCVPFIRAKYRLPRTPPGAFAEISGKEWQQHDVNIKNFNKITDDICPKLTALLDKYWKLSEKEKERIDVILNRLLKSKNSQSVTDKILEVAIALEMMLLDENKTDQLSLSFRLRGAWLLEEDAEQRLKTYKDLKNLYIYRSQAAHTGQLSDGKKKQKKIQAARDEIPRYLEIAESVFEHLLINGKPDWDRLILNAKSSN